MKKTKTAALLLVLILVLALSACSAAPAATATPVDPTATSAPAGPTETTAPAAGEPAKLEGTRWTLVSYGPVGSQIKALPDVKTELSFAAEGRLSGNAGCNGFGGVYRQDGQKLTIGEIMQTMMACDPAGVMQQETSVTTLLAATGSFSIEGQQLTLTSADGSNALIYTNAQ